MNNIISQFRFSESDQPQHNHYHLSCEMILVLEGEAEFLVDGQQYLGGSGSLVFLNSFEQHEVKVKKTPYRRYFLTIDSAEMERMLSYTTLSSIFKNRPAGFRHCVCFSSPEREEIFSLVERLYKEYSAPGAYSGQMLRSLFEQLLIEVYRICPGNFAHNESGSASRVIAIQKYIEEHFTEEIRISDLARQFFISPYYLSHTFAARWAIVPSSTSSSTAFPTPRSCWRPPTCRSARSPTNAASATPTISSAPSRPGSVRRRISIGIVRNKS
ncbi:MAG: AraC family ligand binding domain-containing protein [Oscillospiraceae bacterium]|nr:AraC family ligand binding domain-containing protein [Oscillospiraceae bacterium]